MPIGTRFYQLWDPDYVKVATVFRMRETADELFVERYDPALGAWTEGPGSLLRYVFTGEDGADRISQKEAEQLIAAGLPTLPTL